MSDRTDPRRRLLDTALDLLRETGDPAAVTVRRIAKRAGVGIGLLNYHFGTKDELVKECVRHAIDETIRQWDAQVPARSRSARGRVEAMLEAAAGFLAEHPRVARISIHYDLQRPRPDDNTSATIAGLLPALREIFGPRTSEQELRLVAVQLVAPIQFAFLRDGSSGSVDLDFHDPAARRRFIRRLVANVLPSSQKGSKR